jgi:hypothetical protein
MLVWQRAALRRSLPERTATFQNNHYVHAREMSLQVNLKLPTPFIQVLHLFGIFIHVSVDVNPAQKRRAE